MNNKDLISVSISYAVILVVALFLLKVAFGFFIAILPVALIIFIILKISQGRE